MAIDKLISIIKSVRVPAERARLKKVAGKYPLSVEELMAATAGEVDIRFDESTKDLARILVEKVNAAYELGLRTVMAASGKGTGCV